MNSIRKEIPQDLEAPATEITAWVRGIEKMLAAAPARGFRREVEDDSDVRLDQRLASYLEDGEGCRSFTWSTVVRHSAHPQVRSASPRTDSCHVRGHPGCRVDLALSQLEKHRHRFAVAYGGQSLVRLRLVAPESWGYEMTKEFVQKWGRRRPIERMLPAAFGQFGIGPDGRYGLTILTVDGEQVDALGEAWVEAGGAVYETSSIAVDAFEAAVALKAEAESAVFELVDDGVISPDRARGLLIEEFKQIRTKFMGGFLDLSPAEKEEEWLGVDKDEDPPQQLEDTIGDHRAGPPDAAQNRKRFDEMTYLYNSNHIDARALETDLQRIKEAASEGGDQDLVADVDRQLAALPEEIFNCDLHARCRTQETGLRLRTRFVRQAVDWGQAVRDRETDVMWWTTDSWPAWKKLAETIREEGR